MCINREKRLQIKMYSCCSCILDQFVILKFSKIRCHELIITTPILQLENSLSDIILYFLCFISEKMASNFESFKYLSLV